MKKNNSAFIYFIFACIIIASSTTFNTVAFAQQDTDSAKLIRFKYQNGDAYRILSTVNEDVLVNGALNHHSVIVNRISVKVTGTSDDGSGTMDAVFMTSENGTNTSSGTVFTWGEEYKSIFTRSARGIYTIGDEYFMPVVRDVPVFPDMPVKPGDSWTAQGHEAHDLRQTFGIEKPFKVPFTASYTYTGTMQGKDGRTFDVIDVRYNLYYESPVPKGQTVAGSTPEITMGYSHQTLYWDNEKGELDHYAEEFRIAIDTHYGDEFVFTGTAEAEVTEFSRTDTDRNVAAVEQTVKDMGLENVTVAKNDRGLTISIENIQFLADSAVLRDSEKQKIEKIAEILKQYPNDLLITGYCALRGTAEERQKLSEERAQSVADDLLSQGVRTAPHLFTQGKGAENPIASNNTEEGRARNRRVEITILNE